LPAIVARPAAARTPVAARLQCPPHIPAMMMRTRPCKMAIILWPGAPLAKIVARVSSLMRRCEDGIGILVAESGEQEGASEEIAPLGECGSDQICSQSAENRAAGLFRYRRTFAHEAKSLLLRYGADVYLAKVIEDWEARHTPRLADRLVG
jgi:hypothetical protein